MLPGQIEEMQNLEVYTIRKVIFKKREVNTDKSVHSFSGPLEELDSPDRPQLREHPPDLVLVQLVAHAALQGEADTPPLVI